MTNVATFFFLRDSCMHRVQPQKAMFFSYQNKIACSSVTEDQGKSLPHTRLSLQKQLLS